MIKHVFIGCLAGLVILVGLIEGAVMLPLVAVGWLLALARSLSWWVRLGLLGLTALIWATAQAVSPVALLFILLAGSWFDAWLQLKLSSRASLFWTSLVVMAGIGGLRAVSFSLQLLAATAVQVAVFWQGTRLLKLTAPRPALFYLPPQPLPTTDHDT